MEEHEDPGVEALSFLIDLNTLIPTILSARETLLSCLRDFLGSDTEVSSTKVLCKDDESLVPSPLSI